MLARESSIARALSLVKPQKRRTALHPGLKNAMPLRDAITSSLPSSKNLYTFHIGLLIVLFLVG